MITRLSNSVRFRFKRLVGKLGANSNNDDSKLGRPRKQDTYTRFASNTASLIGPLQGKTVLEIGSDNEAAMLSTLVAAGVAEAIGVNPVLPADAQRGNMRLIKGDARPLPLPDESMDVVVSISALAHVFKLEEVFTEIYRVLRKGGYFYAEFGPIWSSVWGHVLWLYHNGKLVDWRSHPLPPYAHLLMTPPELREWCAARFGDRELAGKISDYVFQCPDQNRLFFSDYDEIVSRTKFEKLLFTGCPDVPEEKPAPGAPMCEHLLKLRQLYPDKSGFGYHVARLLLRKPKS
jgi:SAM-dependent methyltransferase